MRESKSPHHLKADNLTFIFIYDKINIINEK